MRRLVLITLVLVAGLLVSQPAFAQQTTSLPVTNPVISYEFGRYIIFQALLNIPSPASEAYLLFRADGEVNTRVVPIQPDTAGNIFLRYELSQEKVRPFAMVTYNYRVKLLSGEELVSEDFFFQYEDNRFPWQVVSGGDLTIHWYAGDTTFGQAALDAARRGIQKTSGLLLVKPTKPINIYIYSSSTDLSNALEIGGLAWVGGHASPDLRLGLVSIAPGPEQGLEMDRKIPHELAHILTYDLLGERYTRLPVWLREGIASQVELAANPDYSRVLQQASDQKTLMPLSDLCGAFPPESGRAFLSYAQSESFTRFIIDKYGQSGLLALTNAYSDGLDCEQGMRRALGQPLSQVDVTWRAQALGVNVNLTALNNLFPYLAILAVMLTVTLVSAFTFRKSNND